MPTSVYIPDKLLKQADKRAQALGISRSRLIVRALERELQASSDWSPEFLAQLRATDANTAGAVDEMLREIRRRRCSRPPQRF